MGITAQRMEILNIIRTTCEHLTAQQILDLAHQNMHRLALGTVYRNLNILASEGTIRRVVIPGQPDRFDGNVHPHHHMVCLSCCKVCDAPLDNTIEQYFLHTDWNITGYDIVVYGVCPECKHKKDMQKEKNADDA